VAYALLAWVLIYTFLPTKPTVSSIFMPYIMNKNKNNFVWNVNDLHVGGLSKLIFWIAVARRCNFFHLFGHHGLVN
jgi:hypothetical protein